MLELCLLHNDMGDFSAESGNSFQILQDYFFSYFCAIIHHVTFFNLICLNMSSITFLGLDNQQMINKSSPDV